MPDWKRGMSTPVLRGGCIKDPNSVRGILLMVLVVPLRLRPVVRPIIPLTVTLLVVLPVPIPAAIHVIAAAMIPVRPAKLTGTVLMSDLQNAVAAILVPIPVLPFPWRGQLLVRL